MELSEWKKLYESDDFKKEYECPGERFGALYHKNGTKFRVWAPLAKEVVLHLYKAGTDTEEVLDTVAYDEVVASYGKGIQMNQGTKGIFEISLSGDLHGVYYTYEIRRENNGALESIETQDPYATAVGANGHRSMVVDMEKTNPMNWDMDNRFVRNADSAIIYELHVKDFSNDPHSGISEENRGKYLAFTEENTTVDSEGLFSTGISYLKELGITHVHLLPTYDFGSIDELGSSEQFNWGYDPVNYRVPEGSYATDALHGEVRIFEFKQMVKALHDAGMGVILDMVFNHTFSMDSPLQKCVPYYYYRQDEDGNLLDGASCGNETASERAMYRRYMIDTVLFFATEYHIDGFRFDLMGVHDHETMNEIRMAVNSLPKGKNILVYGEPWSAKPVSFKEPLVPANKAHIRYLDERVAVFHDGTRDAIKGSVFEAKEGGFVNGGEKDFSEEIKHSIFAWCDTDNEETPKSPKQVISYVSAHDNYTLWDKLVLTMDEEEDFVHGTGDILKTNKLIAALLQMSLGTPFFQAGEEFARTKFGDENSYISAPSINQLDWKRRVVRDELVQYYKGLIQLRKMCPVFTSDNPEIIKNFVFDMVEKSLVSYRIKKTGCLKWTQLMVVLNAGDMMRGIPVPDGKWQLLVDNESSMHFKDSPVFIEDSVNVPGHCAVILGKIMKVTADKEEFESRMKDRIPKGGKAMDFLSKVTEKLTETGKYAAEVVKDTSEIISLKNQISSLKKENKGIYEQIGRRVFEMEASKEESPFHDLFEKLKENEEQIQRLQQKVDLMKDSKRA